MLYTSLTDDGWVDCLLGFAGAKGELGASPAEVVLGQPFRVSVEFLPKSPSPCSRSLVLSPHPQVDSFCVSAVHLPDTFVLKTLETFKVVFVRHDAHRTPLRPLYDGPFQVLGSGQKHFVLDFSRCRETACGQT